MPQATGHPHLLLPPGPPVPNPGIRVGSWLDEGVVTVSSNREAWPMLSAQSHAESVTAWLIARPWCSVTPRPKPSIPTAAATLACAYLLVTARCSCVETFLAHCKYFIFLAHTICSRVGLARAAPSSSRRPEPGPPRSCCPPAHTRTEEWCRSVFLSSRLLSGLRITVSAHAKL